MRRPPTIKSTVGLSLLEVMVALLLLTMASTMIYSMLNRSLFFANQGEKKSQGIAKQYALISLLERQVRSGWYNPRTKKVLIAGEKDFLRLATATPFQTRPAQVVMAFYRYSPAEKTLYYLEKKDFYNTEYDDLIPDFSEMTALVTAEQGLSLDFDEEGDRVTLGYGGHVYTFRPWCAPAATEVGDV